MSLLYSKVIEHVFPLFVSERVRTLDSYRVFLSRKAALAISHAKRGDFVGHISHLDPELRVVYVWLSQCSHETWEGLIEEALNYHVLSIPHSDRLLHRISRFFSSLRFHPSLLNWNTTIKQMYQKELLSPPSTWTGNVCASFFSLGKFLSTPGNSRFKDVFIDKDVCEKLVAFYQFRSQRYHGMVIAWLLCCKRFSRIQMPKSIAHLVALYVWEGRFYDVEPKETDHVDFFTFLIFC